VVAALPDAMRATGELVFGQRPAAPG